MPRFGLILFSVVLLGAPLAATAQDSASVEFDAPAQFGPAATASGSAWAYILLVGPTVDFIVELQPGAKATYVNTTVAIAEVPHERDVFAQTPARSSSARLPAGVGLHATGAGEAAVVYIEASELVIDMDVPGEINRLQGQDCRSHRMTLEERERYRLRTLGCFGPPAAVVRTTASGPGNVEIHARGQVFVELHDINVACAGSGACPTGGHRHEDRVDGPKETALAYEELGWTLLEGAGQARLRGGEAEIAAVIMGASSLDLDVSGWMRLPTASMDRLPACEGCIVADDQTLWARGDLHLGGLSPSDASGRLQAHLSGDLTAARLDEEGAVAGAGRAAAATGIAAGLAFAARVAFGLVTRLTERQALTNDNRRRLNEHIHERPGATFRELQRASGLAVKSTRHHLAVLKRSGIVVEHGHQNTRRFFPNHGAYDDSWDTVVLRRDADLARLHDWLLDHPGVPQKSIVEAAAGWGWSRGTTQYRLAKLAEGSLVRADRHGRQTIYTASRQARSPSPAKAPLAWVARREHPGRDA